MTEGELLARAQGGDEEALARLCQEAYPLLFGYLQKLTLDRQLTEDLTQKAMLRGLERLGQFRGESKFSTWLIKIATNLYQDELRTQRRKVRLWQEPREPAPDPLLPIAVREVLAELSPKLRAPILLKYYGDLSYAEIAELLEVPVGTVKSRLYTAHRQLQKLWEGAEGDEG